VAARDERARLLTAVADELLEQGSSGASLSGLARAVGSNNRMLLYYFHSKEELFSAASHEVSSRYPRLQNLMDHLTAPGTLRERFRRAWLDLSADEMLPFLRFFFEAFGVASHHPDRYTTFLDSVSNSWPPAIIAALERDGYERAAAEVLSVQIMAVWRGLQFALLSGSEREALTAAHDGALDALLHRHPE
jgi:AcrR family transcriptional regulator